MIRLLNDLPPFRGAAASQPRKRADMTEIYMTLAEVFPPAEDAPLPLGLKAGELVADIVRVLHRKKVTLIDVQGYDPKYNDWVVVLKKSNGEVVENPPCVENFLGSAGAELFVKIFCKGEFGIGFGYTRRAEILF